MIASLSGIISSKDLDLVILDVGGVGYGVLVIAEDYGRLNEKQTVTLYIYEYIREQAHDLYGFLNRETKAFFEQLLAVNGVGPKMALAILNTGSVETLREAIASGDAAIIAHASGVGKRLAERVVVDLKDKVGLIGDSTGIGLMKTSSKLLGDEAVAALIALGYSSADAARSLQSIDKTLPIETRVTEALKRMS
jgi:Holliday junction DNA helicase RuvA